MITAGSHHSAQWRPRTTQNVAPMLWTNRSYQSLRVAFLQGPGVLKISLARLVGSERHRLLWNRLLRSFIIREMLVDIMASVSHVHSMFVAIRIWLLASRLSICSAPNAATDGEGK